MKYEDNNHCCHTAGRLSQTSKNNLPGKTRLPWEEQTHSVCTITVKEPMLILTEI